MDEIEKKLELGANAKKHFGTHGYKYLFIADALCENVITIEVFNTLEELHNYLLRDYKKGGSAYFYKKTSYEVKIVEKEQEEWPHKADY